MHRKTPARKNRTGAHILRGQAEGLTGLHALEVIAGMGAGGAHGRSFGADVGEAAVLAAPHAGFGGLEHGIVFDGLGKGEEAAFVFHFSDGDIAHDGGDGREAFSVGVIFESVPVFVAE